MGWASGGEIFDRVADGLIAAKASEAVKRRVLTDLIILLQNGDWDTEDESLDRFRNDPVIVEIFRERGIEPWEDDE
jgi:hypothetical protein